MSGVIDQVREQFLGADGRAWAGSVEDLLFEGETVDRTVSLGDNRVVVTSHRLLAFTPEADGENYSQVDIPNVADVRAGYDGETNLLAQAARVGLYGVVLLGVGVFLDFESFVPTDVFGGTGAAAGRLGLGGIIGMMQTFLGLIAQIDDFALMIGALLVLFCVFILAVYLLTRDRVLVVAVAGDDEHILVPTGDEDVSAAVSALESALFEHDAGASESSDAGFGADDPL